ncbi:MAG: hypothetical protein AB7U82_07605 [Blastocatellales bacterium]
MKKINALMLSGLIIVATDSISAQNACSKEVDGRKVNFEIVNKTDKPFIVNFVDHKCKEGRSNQQVAPGGTFKGMGYNGHVFRVREVGANKLLREFVANPTNPSRIIIGSATSNVANPSAPAAKQQPNAVGKQPSNAVMATKFPILAGTGLKRGMKYPSPSGNHFLIFANDGNLVVATKSDGFVWGLNQVSNNFSQSDRVEVSPQGKLVVYDDDAKGKAIWTTPGRPDAKAKLNLTFSGALQLVSATGGILWSSDGNLAPAINVFTNKPNVKPCSPEPGWAKCLELPSPALKIFASRAVSQSALNGVANVYTEMTKRFRAAKYPMNKFDGYKVYLTNGEPWSELSKISPVGTMWPDQTGPKSGSVLRGGAGDTYLWIEENMICKQGIKVLLALGIQDKDTRSLDQVVHEFAHAIDRKYIPDQTVNLFNGVEGFAWGIQNWFGTPGGTLSPAQEAVLKDFFTSRATFSCEGYRP